jgi:hypothetical protein
LVYLLRQSFIRILYSHQEARGKVENQVWLHNHQQSHSEESVGHHRHRPKCKKKNGVFVEFYFLVCFTRSKKSIIFFFLQKNSNKKEKIFF